VLASSVSGKSNKTQMFNPSVRAALIEGASLEQSIFLLRKPVSSSIRDLRTFTVGRTQQNDILMNDFAISREHAVVELRGDRYYLKDLGSSNGTYVGGKLIDDRGTLLQDGHAVRFARYEFNFLSVGALFELLKKRSVAAIDAAL
jgi:pSer/pThr/pTyr-binding forkhead associated (FHA) protein